jgi:hypothetical protein
MRSVSTYAVLLPLGTAVIGAGAALAGNMLGPLVGSRREHQQWLRDKRAELLEAAYAMHMEARDTAWDIGGVVARPKTAADWKEYEDRCRVVLDRLIAASAKAELYVSPGLAEQLSKVAYDFQVVYSARDLYDAKEWSELRNSWSDDVDKCAAGIRKELGVD